MTLNIKPLLQQVALFSELPEDLLTHIANEIRELHLTANEVLFREGDEGDTFYFIQRGEIEIYDEKDGQKKTTLALLKTGEYFGEMALIEEKPRSASARAVSETTLLTLERQTFLHLLETNAKLALKMSSLISARLRTSQPTTTPSTPQKDNITRVFISYSRKDKAFVQHLHQAISSKGIDTWVDWENIPLTADWWNEIQTGIENTDAFAFVISPDSLNSAVCGREVQTAVDNHKRLIPILHREPQKGDPLHDKIASHNWVYMRSEEELEKNLQQMLEIVNTDLAWVRQHTRLRERALEWERAKKHPSFLLHGVDLQNAENWLEAARSKQPLPTPLHVEYLQASRRVSTLRQRALLTYTLVGLVITLALAIFSFASFLQARTARIDAENARIAAEANAVAAENANALAQNNAATAEAGQRLALEAQATAEAERNLAATAQALAEEQEFIARAGRLESLPLTMLDGRLDLALLLSVEAYRFNPSLSSENTLFAAWSHNPELLRYLQGHEHGVLAAAWSADRQLATGDEGGTIIFWDNQSGLPTQVLQGIEGKVLALAWSTDGQLASGDSDGNVIVWDTASGLPIQTMAGHTGSVNALAWNAHNQLTSGGEDGQIIVWNIPRGQPQYTLNQTNASILDLDWSPLGVLASANSDDTITIWGQNEIEGPPVDTRITTTETISTTLPRSNLTLLQPDVQTVAWSPNNQLASGGFQQIILWDFQLQAPAKMLEGHSLFVNSLAWSERGQLASGASDNTVIVWDLENGRPQKTFRGHNDWVQSVAWSPDGILASAALDQTVILWHPGERAGTTLRGHEGQVYATAYAPDGTLASGGEDRNVILWDLELRRPDTTLSGHRGAVLSVAWSSDGQLASGGADQNVILWNLTNSVVGETLTGHTAAVETVVWSPAGQLASADEAGTVIVWDLASGQPQWSQAGTGERAMIAWSPNDELTLGSNNGTITILDTNFEPTKTLTSKGPIHAIAWSPDGRLATDGVNYQIFLWSLETGQPEMQMRGHSNTITDLSWSADGRLASSAEDSSIILWELDAGRPAFILRGHTSLVQAISWAADGNLLASAALDGTVMVWDVTPEAWIMRNCSRAGRNMDPNEWGEFFSEEPYRPTCGP